MTDELLVHISAPTTRQTDELYRSLAGAYLKFEPQRTHADELRQDVTPNPSTVSRPNDPTPSDQKNLAVTSFLSTSKDSYGSFPSHLSFDGHSKARTGDREQFHHGAEEHNVGTTSSRLDQLDRIHRNWKKQKTPKSSFTSERLPIQQVSSSPDDANTAFIEDTQEAARQLQSQLSDSYYTTSADTSENDSDEEGTQGVPPSRTVFSEHSVKCTLKILVPETPKYGSAVSHPRRSLRLRDTGSVAESPIPAPLELSTNSSAAIPQAQESLRVNNTSHSSPLTPKGEENERVNKNAIEKVVKPIDLSKLCVDAYPPEPKVSVACPGGLPSQITEALAVLKQQHPKRFKPIKKQGNPGPDDRGFWHIQCAHWPLQLQNEFWNNMCEQIASGRLGWGVTLHREGGNLQSLGIVRLYCWGELVEHMWLVLWLLSRGKVIGSNLKWFDADGIAIFEMG